MLSQADHQLSKSQIKKIILAFAVFVSCLILGYFTYQATCGYLDSPTTIELSTQKLYEFPKVSLFLPNIINGSKVKFVGLTKLHIKYLLGQNHKPGWALTDEDNLELDQSNISTLGKDINNVCKAHNFTRPDLLEYVKYDWNDLVEISPDLSTDERARMEYRVNLLRLTMFKERQYNNSQTIKSRLPTLKFWLKDHAEETPYVENKYLFGTGGAIDFENSDIFSITSPITISSKVSTYIYLTIEQINLLNRLNSPCRQSDESYEHCSLHCWMQTTECEYDCKWWSKELEDLMEQKFCSNRLLSELRNHSCYQIYDECTEKCSVPPCQYWQYNAQIHYRAMKNINRTEVRIGLRWGWRVIVHENKYTMSWIDYTSNVAGLVGMFFGGSVVTIICFCCSWFIRPRALEILKHKNYKISQKQNAYSPDGVMHV